MRIKMCNWRRATKAFAVVAAAGGLAAALILAGSPSGTAEAIVRPYKPLKNVIVMISDGAGYNHVTMTDYYVGKKQAYETFPVRLGMSTYEYEKFKDVANWYANPFYLFGYDPLLMWKDFTYSAYPFSTDSASAATAMASGIKTYNGAIGVDISGKPLQLVSQAAEAKGKATGVISTVEWSHATPAGFVAHNVSRNNYADIAKEMIQSSGTDVIMGTGNPEYDDNGKLAVDETGAPKLKDAKYVGGLDLWNALKAGTAGGDADGDGKADPWKLIQTKAEFEQLATATDAPKRVCGTAQVYSTTQQARSDSRGVAAYGSPSFYKDDAPYAVPLTSTIPDLATMTKGAINVLDADQDGFFLMIEGGAVDWASHANETGRTIEEQIDFNKAVDAVIQWVEKNSNWNETLLIVTADHETGMLWGPGSGGATGYLGKFMPIVNNGAGKLPGAVWSSGEHTNQLIPLYAKGNAENQLADYATTIKDPVRGRYLDNTDLGSFLVKLMK